MLGVGVCWLSDKRVCIKWRGNYVRDIVACCTICDEGLEMKQFKWVITNDNKIGVIRQILPDGNYFVMFPLSGMIYHESELKEWHGCW